MTTENIYTYFIVRENSTGEEWTEAFGSSLTYNEAMKLINKWNRSQIAHKQEFTYRLP